MHRPAVARDGNWRVRRARRARPAWAILVPVLFACTSAPVETRTVTLHVPAACALQGAPYATITASGDYQPATSAPEQLVFDRVGALIASIPAGARALTVSVTSAQAGDLPWRGIGPVGAHGDVDVLVWPATSACPLSPPASPLADRAGAAIGAFAGRALVAGGSMRGAPADAFVADLTRGVVMPVASNLVVPRVAPTVTAFGGGALVAGGARLKEGDPLDSAEVFDGTGFDGAPILLSEPRASHAAVVLASGGTLLVGGSGLRGPLASLDLVDPATRRARGGLAQLEYARTGPMAIRLASGEILVAGGVDAQGAPVPWIEWLSADGTTHTKHSRQLAAGRESGVVALPGGGALAVVAPSAPADGFRSVWVVSGDGDLESASPIQAPMAHVRLFRGAAGAPVLWTGDRWWRWQPWRGAFDVMASVDSANGPERVATASPDDGLALWLGAAGADIALYGWRFDLRTPFVTDSARAPLLVDDASPLAPDRLVTGAPDGALAFDAARGLVLSPGASAFLPDASFASFALDLKPTGVAPLVVLRDESGAELEVGGPTCPIAISDAAPSLHVERSGAHVTVRLADGADQPCAALVDPAARLSIGLRGSPSGPSSATALDLTRR